MIEKTKKISNFIREVLQPIYFAVWLILVFASIIPQVYSIFFNPVVIEGARYSTIVLVSIFGSYLLSKRSEKKTRRFKGTLGKTEKKIDELKIKTESIFQEIDKIGAEFTSFKTAQDGKYEDLDKKISQSIGQVTKLNALTVGNHEALLNLSERLRMLFFIKCPVCRGKIDLNIPNTIISGIHEVDGRASDDTLRGTKELSVQCPQCRREFHIDIPHSELTKV